MRPLIIPSVWPPTKGAYLERGRGFFMRFFLHFVQDKILFFALMKESHFPEKISTGSYLLWWLMCLNVCWLFDLHKILQCFFFFFFFLLNDNRGSSSAAAGKSLPTFIVKKSPYTQAIAAFILSQLLKRTNPHIKGVFYAAVAHRAPVTHKWCKPWWHSVHLKL